MKSQTWLLLATPAFFALCACQGQSSPHASGSDESRSAALQSAPASGASWAIDPNDFEAGVVLQDANSASPNTLSMLLSKNYLHLCSDVIHDTAEQNQQLARITLSNTTGKKIGEGNYVVVADAASAPADSNVATVTVGTFDANCTLRQAKAAEGTVSLSWIFEDSVLGSYDLTVGGQHITGNLSAGSACTTPNPVPGDALPGADGGQCVDASLGTLLKNAVAMTDSTGAFTGKVVLGETQDLCAAVQSGSWPTGDLHMGLYFVKKNDGYEKGVYTVDNTSDKYGPIADLSVRMDGLLLYGSVTLDAGDASGASGSYDLTGDPRGEAKGTFKAAPCVDTSANAATAAP